MPTPSPRRRSQRAGLIEHDGTHDTVLLIMDMISCWSFPDAAPLLRQALHVVPAIARLKQRCLGANVPVIYANDNRGQWRSDFKFVVNESLESPGPGADITRQLEPGPQDYFVLKPKHSAFFATPLEILLDHLRAERMIIVGVAGDQCVAYTAADARMRDFEVLVPSDCIASQTLVRNRRAVQGLEEGLRIKTSPSSTIRFGRHAQHAGRGPRA
jgi:nicotinamidase-related amidase